MPVSDADREVGLAEQIRLAIERFHDGLPQGQGDIGDGGVAGRAMCQLFYDHSDEIIEALQSQRDCLQAERDALERAGLEDCIAQALYDDWRDECELHDVEMIDWRRLPDKETWRSRARAVLKAIRELKP